MMHTTLQLISLFSLYGTRETQISSSCVCKRTRAKDKFIIRLLMMFLDQKVCLMFWLKMTLHLSFDQAHKGDKDHLRSAGERITHASNCVFLSLRSDKTTVVKAVQPYPTLSVETVVISHSPSYLFTRTLRWWEWGERREGEKRKGNLLCIYFRVQRVNHRLRRKTRNEATYAGLGKYHSNLWSDMHA